MAIEYSIFAQIVFDVFSIPSMSVESEWVFSGYESIIMIRLI